MNQNLLPGECPKRKSRRHLFNPVPGATDGAVACTCGERLIYAAGIDAPLSPEPPFTIGQTVGHSDAVIQRARDYLCNCGREPMRSGAAADLEKKIAARGLVHACERGAHAPWVVKVSWNDGTVSECLPHRVMRRHS